MKNALNISLHPTSLLLGLAVGLLALVTMAQKPQDIRELVRVEYGPHPRDMVVLEESQPGGPPSYVVPPGKILVITAIGTRQWDSSGSLKILVDGQNKLYRCDSGSCIDAIITMTPVPPHFTVQAGASVDVRGGNSALTDDARAWGYLADA